MADAFGTDIALHTAAAGARRVFLRRDGGLESAGWVEARAARIVSDAAAETAGNLAAPSSATSRVRFVLEGTQPFDLGEGRMLTPTVEISLRRDGGDAETGAGVELGGSVAGVRAGLRDGSVPVNAVGAWLHNIEGDAYVVSPACFEAFAAGRELAPATVRHRVVRLRRHRQRASRSGAANLFRAVLADGSRVEGMVFPGELIWDGDAPPRANAELVGKRR